MPIPFLAAAGALSSVIGSIFKGSQAKKQQRMADAIHPVNAMYNQSPYAKNQLGTVQQMMNGRMAGAGAEEQNIQGNFANSMGSVGRNSTSGAQSLAMLGGLQGNANNAFSQLQQKEGMNSQNFLSQLSAANQGMTNENVNVYNDQLRNYNNDLSAKNALQSAAWQNKGAMWDGISNALIGAGDVAQQISDQKNGTMGSGIPNMPMGFNAPAGGSYIDPRRQSPQMNYVNPFIH